MINKWLSHLAAFFLYLLSLLPLAVLYLISDFLFLVLFHGIKYRRHVVLQNMQHSFPERSLEELKALEKEFYQYLCDLIVEIIKMFSASEAFIRQRYSFSNTELLRRFEQENQSFLFAVGHYGNWEWSCVVIPTVTDAQPLVIYKPMNNKVFEYYFDRARTKSGSLTVEMKNTMRKMAELRKHLTVTVFAADQTPGSAASDVFEWVNFLNQPTAFFLGVEKVAKSTGYPVIFCDVTRPKRGYYHCDFKLITDNPKATAPLEITRAHVKLLENRINEKPPYWLWSHKRWKLNKFLQNNQNTTSL